MSYFLEAIIGKKTDILKNFKSMKNYVVELNYDFAMIPLTEKFMNAIQNIEKNEPSEKFDFWIKNHSKDSMISYISAEYFGGAGGQTIKLYKNEELIEEINNDNAINHVLEVMGLKAVKNIDQFELVGLSKHRSTDDWL